MLTRGRRPFRGALVDLSALPPEEGFRGMETRRVIRTPAVLAYWVDIRLSIYVGVFVPPGNETEIKKGETL